LEYHRAHKKLATVTTVRPTSRFGVMDVDSTGQVISFKEKPVLEGWINIGFFIFEPKVLEYLTIDSVLELDPLEALAREGELMAYRHKGFWQPMDTYREFTILNDMWNEDNAPWKNWNQ